MNLEEKLSILADAAKYDASCASSGSEGGFGRLAGTEHGTARLGSASLGGVCHSFAGDGRCISLLKVLFTNACVYDCAYCINRRSNARRRASFTVRELVDLTTSFYRRNYIEGLFLSSGVVRSPDYTMERLLEVVKTLRLEEGFGGYIHLKAIPGASLNLVREAGLYADRLSANIELPTEASLTALAPEKKGALILGTMRSIRDDSDETDEDKRRGLRAPSFLPAGQSTQLIVGASPETDFTILRLASGLYGKMRLRRVYYSAFVPVNRDPRLPAAGTPPMIREHRLYQADWLLRFYGFRADELLGEEEPNLDQDIDPKEAWAVRHPEFFPVELTAADKYDLLRVPGVGRLSAARIVSVRKSGRLDFEGLGALGVVLKRAAPFVTIRGRACPPRGTRSRPAPSLRRCVGDRVRPPISGRQESGAGEFQLSLF